MLGFHTVQPQGADRMATVLVAAQVLGEALKLGPWAIQASKARTHEHARDFRAHRRCTGAHACVPASSHARRREQCKVLLSSSSTTVYKELRPILPGHVRPPRSLAARPHAPPYSRQAIAAPSRAVGRLADLTGEELTDLFRSVRTAQVCPSCRRP